MNICINIKSVVFLFLLWILVSCSKENNSQESYSISEEVILDMIADNDLDYFAVTNINQMEYAFAQNMNLGKLYVYIDRARHTSKEIPILYEIQADTTPKIVSKIIKQYPEQNASSSYGSYKEAIHYGKISAHHTLTNEGKIWFLNNQAGIRGGDNLIGDY